MIGGPPCQGFSPLNMRGVGLERRGLWREYLRALERAAAARVRDGERARAAALGRVRGVQRRPPSELGYDVEGEILNAADYGVPQTRRRAIVIGARDGHARRGPSRRTLRPAKRAPLGGSRGGRSATPSRACR